MLVNQVYYRCFVDYSHDPPIPIVDTWWYRGTKKLRYSSSECDTPFHFFHFELYGLNRESKDALYIPSRRQVAESMLTFEEFVAEFTDMQQELGK